MQREIQGKGKVRYAAPDRRSYTAEIPRGVQCAAGRQEFHHCGHKRTYARDISKKRRISNKIKGNAGEPMGPPPYGYKKDPDDPKRWIVDEEAAQVVRRVFRMTLDGYGTCLLYTSRCV